MFPINFGIWVVEIGVYGRKLMSVRRAVCHRSQWRVILLA